jgi:hypothetical protein
MTLLLFGLFQGILNANFHLHESDENIPKKEKERTKGYHDRRNGAPF